MARFIRLEDGAVFHMGQGYSRRLISPDNGDQNITLNYSIFQGGQEFPQHFHDISADIFIVLRGSVSVRQGHRYTPIVEGDFAYIPPGEVHGTVNHTDDEANLISFQSPPDPALYKGERDPSQTGVMPAPDAQGETAVRIGAMGQSDPDTRDGIRCWSAANPAWGAREMTLTYLELDPGACLPRDEQGGGDSVIFVWQGTAQVTCSGDVGSLSHGDSVLLDPGEEYVVANNSDSLLKLIRCTTSA